MIRSLTRSTHLSEQYAPVLFSQAGLPGTTASFIASGVSGIVNVACTVLVQGFADTCKLSSTTPLFPSADDSTALGRRG